MDLITFSVCTVLILLVFRKYNEKNSLLYRINKAPTGTDVEKEKKKRKDSSNLIFVPLTSMARPSRSQKPSVFIIFFRDHNSATMLLHAHTQKGKESPVYIHTHTSDIALL